MFHKDFIEKIESLALNADGLRRIPNGPDYISVHINPETHALTEVITDVSPQPGRFASLADMLAYGLPRHIGPRQAVLAVSASILALRTVESTLLAKTARPVGHEMPLPKTKAFALVESWVSGMEYSARDLVAELRTTLDGCLEATMADRFRRVEASVKIGSATVTDNASKQLDRNVAREVASKGDKLPDEIIVNVPVFDLPGHRDRIGTSGYKVRVLVDADVDGDGKPVLTMTAVERDVRDAIESALDHIVEPNAEAYKDSLQIVRVP